ncbi:hypothetical protein [Thermomonas sp.]|uniref:hypothetical protein n=1 Tax=Thermomonas sp. TaxID=1971895 RepID=UPI0026113E6B|nr:hypothetical protein [Thermomonas sp.]MCO5055749.1 hypothetical protein [Thermomonas sp.]
MRLLNILLATATLIMSSGALADGWRDREGNPVPDSASSKSKDGFAAMLLVTPDKDWQEKWNTPPEVAPHFSTAKEVEAGGEVFILSFLANPRLDVNGMANVTCDFCRHSTGWIKHQRTRHALLSQADHRSEKASICRLRHSST